MIVEEQCEKWSENPDSFVEEEDEDTFAYSVRISSQVFIIIIFIINFQFWRKVICQFLFLIADILFYWYLHINLFWRKVAIRYIVKWNFAFSQNITVIVVIDLINHKNREWFTKSNFILIYNQINFFKSHIRPKNPPFFFFFWKRGR